MTGKAWRRIGRVNGSDAGKMAKPVWLCSNCRCWHDDLDKNGKLHKPLECKFCHRFQFDYFMSRGEAETWGKLHQRQKAGEIRNLRRQVRKDLLTVGREGMACVWGYADIDFGYDELQGGEWIPVLADHKPSAGMSPDAALKFRCLEAMGFPIRILTTHGEV